MVKKAGCNEKLIKARKPLFTPSPHIARLSPFGVDSYERRVLSTWRWTWLFGAVAQVPGLPLNTSYY